MCFDIKIRRFDKNLKNCFEKPKKSCFVVVVYEFTFNYKEKIISFCNMLEGRNSN